MFLFFKKNLNASRPSEHPSIRGENVKTFRWDHRLQTQICLVFGWCPCMAINVSVQQHNGGFLPDIMLLTQSMLLPSSGNLFKGHEEVLFLWPMRSHLNVSRFDRDAQKV